MPNRSSLIVLLAFVCSFGLVSAVGAAEVAATFSLSAPDASSVAIAGSFNHWDPSRHLLAGPDRNGKWSITLFLAPGRYEYLFVINGSRWEHDPAAATTNDGMGGRNSVVLIGPR